MKLFKGKELKNRNEPSTETELVNRNEIISYDRTEGE